MASITLTVGSFHTLIVSRYSNGVKLVITAEAIDFDLLENVRYPSWTKGWREYEIGSKKRNTAQVTSNWQHTAAAEVVVYPAWGDNTPFTPDDVVDAIRLAHGGDDDGIVSVERRFVRRSPSGCPLTVSYSGPGVTSVEPEYRQITLGKDEVTLYVGRNPKVIVDEFDWLANRWSQ